MAMAMMTTMIVENAAEVFARRKSYEFFDVLFCSDLLIIEVTVHIFLDLCAACTFYAALAQLRLFSGNFYCENHLIDLWRALSSLSAHTLSAVVINIYCTLF